MFPLPSQIIQKHLPPFPNLGRCTDYQKVEHHIVLPPKAVVHLVVIPLSRIHIIAGVVEEVAPEEEAPPPWRTKTYVHEPPLDRHLHQLVPPGSSRVPMYTMMILCSLKCQSANSPIPAFGGLLFLTNKRSKRYTFVGRWESKWLLWWYSWMASFYSVTTDPLKPMLVAPLRS